MPLQLNPVTSITFLDPDFVHFINDILRESTVDVSDGVILYFHVQEESKNHPVEVSIDHQGNLKYLILFANSGTTPEAELAWDFTCKRFSQFGRDFDLECGRALLNLYTRNFCTYFKSGVYEVTATPQFKQSIQSK